MTMKTKPGARQEFIAYLTKHGYGLDAAKGLADKVDSLYCGVPSEPEVINGPATLPVGHWVIEDLNKTLWLTRSIGHPHNKLIAGQRAQRIPDFPSPPPPAFVLPEPGTTFWAEVDGAIGTSERRTIEFHRFFDGRTLNTGCTPWDEKEFINRNARIVEAPQ